MKQRRWFHGREETVCGIQFRAVRGEKHPEDLKLLWFVDGQWLPVPLDPVFLIVDMICENEEVLYPSRDDRGHPTRFKGGGEVLRYLNLAFTHGWEKASTALQDARAKRHSRDMDEFSTPADRSAAGAYVSRAAETRRRRG